MGVFHLTEIFVMQPDRRSFLLAGGAAVASLSNLAAAPLPDQTAAAQKFIDKHVEIMKPLDVAAGIGIAGGTRALPVAMPAYARKEETQNKIDAALADKGQIRRGEGR